MRKVSVIIPAHNEEKTIGQVIELVNNNNNDCEVIVVDNCCTDDTTIIATQKGAKVVKCSEIGKGYAMEEGIRAATGEIVVFLDADIINYNPHIINLLIEPIIKENIDFVKSTFERTKGGIVTEIATKPLLDMLFPTMYKFSEPLSGMIAGKKEIFEKLTFEKDYGVDIGIIIDISQMNLKVKEVNIGTIENMSHLLKTTETMRNMSNQIIKAILKRVPGIEIK